MVVVVVVVFFTVSKSFSLCRCLFPWYVLPHFYVINES